VADGAAVHVGVPVPPCPSKNLWHWGALGAVHDHRRLSPVTDFMTIVEWRATAGVTWVK